MGKRMLILTALVMLLSGCAVPGRTENSSPYQLTDLTLFDTVTTITGYAETETEFQQQAQKILDHLGEYHRLFDIYHDYEGISNLKTVNDQAGNSPVQVDSRILDLLSDCITYHKQFHGRMNAAMGSVLKLWHDARSAGLENPRQAVIPEEQMLQEALKHCSFDTVYLDFQHHTVYLADPEQRIDVGAVAKGWSAERVCRQAPAGYLISVGGNVCATGPKPDGSPWIVGVQSPDPEKTDYLQTLALTKGSVVTSGDYQRYFEVDGIRYPHIIDPDTGHPARYWKSVTVICGDSGLADVLSTVLFVLPLKQGQKFLSEVNAEAMWVDQDGEIRYSPGFEEWQTERNLSGE